MMMRTNNLNPKALAKLFFLVSALLFLKTGLAQPLDYDSLLSETEKVRLTDTQLFNRNITLLSSETGKMSAEQNCLLDYLTAYQMAFKGQYESLDSYLEEKIKRCDFPIIQARMLALRANILVISGKFEASLQNLDMAFEAVKEVNDKKVLTMVYSAAAIVYELINQIELSINYAELVNEINPTPQNLCKVNYFRFKTKLENLQQSINKHLIEDSINQCMESDQPIHSLFLNFYYLKHMVDADYPNNYQLQEIANNLSQLELKVSRTNYPNIQSFYWATHAYVEEKLEHFDKAESAANLSLDMNKKLGDTEQKIIALEVLLQVALQKANDEAAYQILKERTDSEQRRFNEKQAKLSAFMKVKHDNLAKTHEIAMLNQKNKLLEMEQVISRQSDSNQRLLLLLLFVLLFFFLLWIWRSHKRQVELKRLSESDHLTQVLNRQGLEAQVSLAMNVAEEHNQIIHMAILDLDHFKKVNDQYGHLTGDWVLKHVVKACKRMLKKNMLMGRLGGEEFAIWLFDYSVKEAKDYFEAMRNEVEKLDCTDSGQELNVTASFGVTNSINSGYKITQLLSHADVALYEAKSSGRNQVVVYHHAIG